MERDLAVVVMGVAGSGKSTIGRRLAGVLGTAFLDADDLHPVENVRKMRAGEALTDADRGPWLRRVAAAADETPGPVVVACSALRRAYRETLRAGIRRPVAFVHLDGGRELLAARLAERTGHFMPPELLDSQLDTLEPLGDDEPGFAVGIAGEPASVVAAIAARLGSGPDAAQPALSSG